MTDEIVTGAVVAITIGFLAAALNYLIRHGQQEARDTQCPPHKWEPQYEPNDRPDGEYKGLKCSKCKRRPGELIPTNGMRFPLFPAV